MTWLESVGVKGIKVDFFHLDSASVMNYFVDILEDAATYHLMVNFHGATIPRGWQRTYLHMMSVDLSFIPENIKGITLYADSQKSNQFAIRKLSGTGKNVQVDCLPRGGFVMTVEVEPQ